MLKAMNRGYTVESYLEKAAKLRRALPAIGLTTDLIVAFPGETEEDFQYLLDWLEEAQLDRVGCFAYEPVAGAAANALPGALPLEVREERRDRFMAKAAEISARKLAAKVGRTLDVIIDEADGEGATGRSKADAPEIDGRVLLRDAPHAQPGDIIPVLIEDADEFDLYGVPA